MRLPIAKNRRGAWAFAWARGMSLAALLAMPASLFAEDDEAAFLKQRVFRIPIEVAAEKNGTIKELRLFVSADQGASWQQVASVPPSQRSFTFRARVDGEGHVHAAQPRLAALGRRIDRGPRRTARA